MAYCNRWCRVAMLATTVLFVSLGPRHARADENAEARVYFEQGNRALARAMSLRGARRTRLLEEALDAYVQSLRIVRSRNVVYNAGVTLEALGRYAEAFAYVEEYLGNTDLEDAERHEAEAKLDALRTHVAVVAVTSEPPGAEVRIDRRDLAPIGTTPIEVAVGDGPHTIHLSLAGYTERELSVVGQVGERVEAAGTLEPRPVTLIVRAPGDLPLTVNGTPVRSGVPFDVLPGRHLIRYGNDMERRIVVEPGQEPTTIDLEAPDLPSGGGAPAMLAVRTNVRNARVSVDGHLVEPGADGRAEVPSGRHTVRVEAPGRAAAVEQVEIPEGADVTLDARLEPEVEPDSTTLGAWPAAFWVVSGMAGLGAIGTAIVARTSLDDYNTAPTTAKADRVDTWNLVADVLGVGAVVLAATALVLTIANHDVEQPPSTLRIGAAPQPGGAIVMAELDFGGPR